MLIKEINRSLNRYKKLMKFSVIKIIEKDMINPEYSDKDGQKWVAKHNLDPILMKSFKEFIII